MRTPALIAALMAALFSAACTPLPEKPWGYEFSLGRFTDKRAPSDEVLMAEFPFSPRVFMEHWHNHTSRDLFANVPAKLDITLTRYTATHSKMSYAISMDLQLLGRDREGNVLARKSVSCTADDFTLLGPWAGSMQQVVSKASADPLTAEGRAETMWQRVMDRCVKDIVVQFGEALVTR